MKTMREILFRGKRIDNGEWVYGYYVHIGPVSCKRAYIIPEYASATYVIEVSPSTVGQFTGLTDRNGKKIFEGDIAETSDFNSEDGYGEIIWDEQTARFAISGSTNILFADFDNYFGNEIEVIGNIHDNSELLKGAD